MNKDTILSLIRHALTFGGGYVVSKGLLSDSLVTELVGAIPTAIGVIWGMLDEYLAWKKTKV